MLAFLIGSVLYLICYLLFEIWKPLPALVLWGGIILEVWLGWIGLLFWPVILFSSLMFASSYIGAFFLSMSSSKKSDWAFLPALTALFPLQIISIQIGFFSEYSTNASPFATIFIITLILAPNLFAILFWWWKKRFTPSV